MTPSAWACGASAHADYTLSSLPLEPRLRTGIVAACFNSRRDKMAVDARYSCYLFWDEEHIFVPGWLRQCGDRDVASLICPTFPLQVQMGKSDGIGWWPLAEQELEAVTEHCHRLGLGEWAELDVHEDGREVDVEAGDRCPKRWLVEGPVLETFA